MAIFGFKKEIKNSQKEEKKLVVRETGFSSSAPSSFSIIKRPRITEKATDARARGVYVFEIEDTAGKHSIATAIRELYKVSPAKVRIVRTPRKKIVVRGKRGTKPGVKKAYVYLAPGDKIEIV